MSIRIGNGAGFLGDQLQAPKRLVESSRLDYLTLEYLAELTLSILAAQRDKDPALGYARDFLDVLDSLAPALRRQSQLKIVTNAGGVNPRGCARQAGQLLNRAGLGDLPLGVVTGDDLLPRIAGGCDWPLEHMDTKQPFAELGRPVASANAYLGAAPLVSALRDGARIVIAGRVADASLTVAPAIHELGIDDDDWNRLAAATIAGHLIECGAQVTGGYSVDWRDGDLTDVGYPIAELGEDGDVVITKPDGSGGRVDRRTVVEQLVYEIGDPRHYLTPDVDVDFTSVSVEVLGENRVRVPGARGGPAPETLKVSLAYHNGYTASGQLLVYGHDCVEKAKATAKLLEDRLSAVGYEFRRWRTELLGGDSSGAALPVEAESRLREVVLRVAVQDEDRAAVERFTKEWAPLITSGPAGLAGYASSRGRVRPVLAYWPTLAPRDEVTADVKVATASQWAEAES